MPVNDLGTSWGDAKAAGTPYRVPSMSPQTLALEPTSALVPILQLTLNSLRLSDQALDDSARSSARTATRRSPVTRRPRSARVSLISSGSSSVRSPGAGVAARTIDAPSRRATLGL
jgi:hypothetical protein